MSHTKATLRKIFRAKRQQLSAQQQHHNSLKICQQLQKITGNQSVVAGYLANDGEVDLSPFFKACWDRQKPCCLPILHPFCNGYLLFQDFSPSTTLENNQYGIAEPILNCCDVVPLSKIDAVLMPLVAFDNNKGRLGMGGGYYDRSLKATWKMANRPKFIGIAHSNQRYSGILPTEPWDIPLDKVVTPDSVI